MLEDREPGGKGEGREETDVLAGALRIPKGSLRLVFDMRRTEPRQSIHQHAAVNEIVTCLRPIMLLSVSSEVMRISALTYRALLRFPYH